MSKLQEKEKLLVQCEEDLKRMRDIHEEIKIIEANRVKLQNYYTSEYRKDYETASNKDSYYRVLNQDSIWNVLDDQYHEKINIVKTIVQSV